MTEAQVWDALAEIPDPEIPVVSLVDLGVVKNVAISLAGPLAGFLFALLVLVAELAGLQPTHPLATSPRR